MIGDKDYKKKIRQASNAYVNYTPINEGVSWSESTI